MEFRRWREEQVRGLRRSVSELHTRLAETNVAETERSAFRDQVKQNQRRLQVLEGLPPMAADEMCSECPRPLQWHRFTASPVLLAEVGPCLAWPRWAERIRGIREQMEQWATLRRESAALAPATPKPAPLAVIPSRTPSSDVIERLSRIQAQHPDARYGAARATPGKSGHRPSLPTRRSPHSPSQDQRSGPRYTFPERRAARRDTESAGVLGTIVVPLAAFGRCADAAGHSSRDHHLKLMDSRGYP